MARGKQDGGRGAKFKVGDRVRLVAAPPAGALAAHAGKEGTVTEAAAHDAHHLASHPQQYSVKLDGPDGEHLGGVGEGCLEAAEKDG